MAEPFIGEIRLFAGTFAPRGWAFCDGRLLQIAQNPALFSLLGTNYGGDGRVTFGLPDLRGRAASHQGHGPGLSRRHLGERIGDETVTLTPAQMPGHTHVVVGTAEPAVTVDPAGARPAAPREHAYSEEADASMAAGALANAGGGQSHENLQPYLVLNYIIAVQGLFPSRA